jgi:hypothetical protein
METCLGHNPTYFFFLFFNIYYFGSLANFLNSPAVFVYFLTSLDFRTPDGEVVSSIFRLIGSHRDRAREFGHASHLHGSGYKSTGLNHRVGHDQGFVKCAHSQTPNKRCQKSRDATFYPIR